MKLWRGKPVKYKLSMEIMNVNQSSWIPTGSFQMFNSTSPKPCWTLVTSLVRFRATIPSGDHGWQLAYTKNETNGIKLLTLTFFAFQFDQNYQTLFMIKKKLLQATVKKLLWTGDRYLRNKARHRATHTCISFSTNLQAFATYKSASW